MEVEIGKFRGALISLESCVSRNSRDEVKIEYYKVKIFNGNNVIVEINKVKPEEIKIIKE